MHFTDGDKKSETVQEKCEHPRGKITRQAVYQPVSFPSASPDLEKSLQGATQ